MRPLSLCAAVAAVLLLGCGKEIGDSCIINSDCDPENTRVCDVSSAGGYCTVIGCDYDTCPDEAVCVRFYIASFENRDCVHATEDISTDDCSVDEVCTLRGQCVPQSSEVRYCMRKCGGDGDCRKEYECRDEQLMIEHGGEPVPPPGQRLGSDLQAFCAEAPS